MNTCDIFLYEWFVRRGLDCLSIPKPKTWSLNEHKIFHKYIGVDSSLSCFTLKIIHKGMILQKFHKREREPNSFEATVIILFYATYVL